MKARQGPSLTEDPETVWPVLQGPDERECRSRTAGRRFLDDAGPFSCADGRCSKLTFSRWFQRLQLHLYGQQRFRLSGSEALRCKAMHLIRAMRELTGQRNLLQPRTHGRMQQDTVGGDVYLGSLQ